MFINIKVRRHGDYLVGVSSVLYFQTTIVRSWEATLLDPNLRVMGNPIGNLEAICLIYLFFRWNLLQRGQDWTITNVHLALPNIIINAI